MTLPRKVSRKASKMQAITTLRKNTQTLTKDFPVLAVSVHPAH